MADRQLPVLPAAVDTDDTDLLLIRQGATDKKIDYALLKNEIAPPATEILQGIAEIATTAEVTTGTDDETFVTPLKLREALQALIPIGMIMIWHSTAGTIPAGWAECNGSGGTPDLRDKFVIGSGGGFPQGNTGGTVDKITTSAGSHTHTVTVDAGGSHNHTGNTSNSGSHNHSITVNNHTLSESQIPAHQHGQTWGQGSPGGAGFEGNNLVGLDILHSTNTATNATGGNGGHNHGASSGNAGTHLHSFTTSTTGNHTHEASTDNTGAHTHSVNVIPPFRSLIYIQKVT